MFGSGGGPMRHEVVRELALARGGRRHVLRGRGDRATAVRDVLHRVDDLGRQP
jgi:hypothetical protein